MTLCSKKLVRKLLGTFNQADGIKNNTNNEESADKYLSRSPWSFKTSLANLEHVF